MGYYPVMLDVSGRCCVVVGAGEVAARRIEGLVQAGARVTVVSPNVSDRLRQLAADGVIRLVQRPYRPGDLRGALLAVAAAGDATVNEAVIQEASVLGIPVNVADNPARCTFISPSVLRRGDLIVAISTSGKCPGLAAHLRRRLEALIGPEYGVLLDLLWSVRAKVAARFCDPGDRKAVWDRLLNADLLESLQKGDRASAEKRVAAILEQAAQVYSREPHANGGGDASREPR